MRNKSSDLNFSTIQLVHECNKTHGTCVKPAGIYLFVFDRYKTHEMRDKAISKGTFMLKYFLNRFKTQ